MSSPASAAAPRPHGWRARLRSLYIGDTPDAHRFRLGLLALDLVSMAWIIAASFLDDATWIYVLDVALGFILLGEYAMRIASATRPRRTALQPVNLADLVAILSLIAAPLLQGALGFLRALRLLRLLHSVNLLATLESELPLFRRNPEAALAAAQLGVFLFVMSGLVYETQHRHNAAIGDYLDALYFTVTTLTTTGFGDITLPGTTGRLLSVVIMLAGVTLFLRLAQALFRPPKVRFPCPQCNLQRHDPDAVHCKACGALLAIPDDDGG